MISHPYLFLFLVAILGAYAFYLVTRGYISTWACLLLFASVFSVEIALEESTLDVSKRQAESEATKQLNSIAHRLSGLISAHISSAEDLAAYIASNPDITQDEFDSFSSKVFSRQKYLVNLATARNLIIDKIYPLEANELALGLNYRDTPSQLDAVLRALENREVVLAGPLELVQGGTALVGRIPVFVTDEKGNEVAWGIVSATIDAQKIMAAAGLNKAQSGIHVSIRGGDGLGVEGHIVAGQAVAKPGYATIEFNLPVAGGQWVMAAAYPEFKGLDSEIWLLRIVFLFLTLGWLVGLKQQRAARTAKNYYQERIRASEQLLQEAGKIAGVAGWKLDATSEKIYVSEEFAKIIGRPTSGILDRDELLSHLAPSPTSELEESVRMAFSQGLPFDIEVPYTDRKAEKWLRIIGSPQVKMGHVFELIGAIQDITERKEFLQTIEFQATRDSLTKLPNRAEFDSILVREIARSKRMKLVFAILFIDLDNFKSVNDNLGHSAGDDLLVSTAVRVQECLRDSDVVARLSGDEFAVLLPDIASSEAAAVVASKIVATMNKPFKLGGRQLFVSASLGIAMYPEDGKRADTLLINADQAMYEVKRSVRNDFRFFTQELQQRSEERHKLFNKLSLALAEGRLELHYQPIIPLDGSGKLACEALVRWREDGEYIPTDSFIELAEETGLITEIDRFVLQEATRFMETLEAAGMDTPALSVNVSPRIFFDRGGDLMSWVEHVKACARRTDLTVELTERLLTQDTPHAMVVLQQLRTEGIKIAIDDFGTGYSSLSYLAKFPVDTLKIDAFFVSNIPQDSHAATLTETIMSLGRELKLRLVAEGVETEQQLQFLQERGCHSAQGYWMSRPLCASDFTDWLNDYRAGAIDSELSGVHPVIV